MTMNNQPNGPYVIEGTSGVNAQVMRQMLETLTRGLSGVVYLGDMSVTANGTPNKTVNIAAGFAVINGTENANQGSYHVWNDAPVSLDILTPHPADATNPRIDIVGAYVQDAQYSGSNNVAGFASITGTPAGSPVPPTIPVSPYFNFQPLANVRIDANVTTIVTAKITDVRLYASQQTLSLSGRTGAGVVGTPPIASGQFMIQAGTNTGTTGAGSSFVVTYPTPFASGVLTVLLTHGDSATVSHAHMEVAQASNTISSFTVAVMDSVTGVGIGNAIGPMRVNWLAIGW